MKTKTIQTCTFLSFFFLMSMLLSCQGANNKVAGDEAIVSLDSSAIRSDRTEAEKNAISNILGSGITAPEASEITSTYYTEQDAISTDYSKSVYFKASELQGFLDAIVDSNKDESLCTGELGVRVYFAKYPLQSSNSYPYPGQRTVILRATCDGKDIPHQVKPGQSETKFVAFNFGDICPPRCVPGDATDFPNAGKYNVNGNCVGCPQ